MAPKDHPSADFFTTGVGYFRAMGIPIVKGRDFDDRDKHGSTPVIIITETFAQQQWGAAAGHYREYLARQPRDVEALINYGVTQVAVGNLDEGISIFARAADLEPANARAKRMLALAQNDRARLATVAPR